MDIPKKFRITPREKEVLGLLCQGNTCKEVARILNISPGTVSDYTRRILNKTGGRNTLHSVMILLGFEKFL